MKYLPYIASVLFAVGLILLFDLLIGGGIVLAAAAGAASAQELPDGVGFSPDELLIGLIRCVPPLVALAAAARILGNIALNSLAGGLAVPVFAGMHAVSALHTGADRIAWSDTTPQEDR